MERRRITHLDSFFYMIHFFFINKKLWKKFIFPGQESVWRIVGKKWGWFVCIGTPRFCLLLLRIVKYIWCTCKSLVLFCIELLNGPNQSVLLSLKNFEHNGLVWKIADTNLWSIESFCIDYYLHRIYIKVLLGFGQIIQISWQGFGLFFGVGYYTNWLFG